MYESMAFVKLAGTLLLAGVAIFRVANRPKADADRLRALPSPDDPRFGPERAPQLAGQACVHCTKKFVVEQEAARCTECAELVHTRICADEHIVQVHKGAKAAYR